MEPRSNVKRAQFIIPPIVQFLQKWFVFRKFERIHQTLVDIVANDERNILDQVSRLDHLQRILRDERIGVEVVDVRLENTRIVIQLRVQCDMLLKLASIDLGRKNVR